LILDRSGGLPLYRFENLPRAGFVHAVSSRLGGVSRPPYATLNLSLMVLDEPADVLHNRRLLASALGFPPERVVDCRQVHGCDVLVVDDAYVQPPEAPAFDIQVTDRPGWLLAARFADCVPLILAHPTRRAVAVVHAGWRGTAAGAAGVAVRALTSQYGADPGGLVAGIGPSIGPCCYEVGPEVADRFEAFDDVVQRAANARPRLDLWQANVQTLLRAGVPRAQIELAGLCTRCHSDLFFSHRALGFPSGRFTATIGLT
jgi:YfiH family protein